MFKVLKEFKDIHTKEIYNMDQEIELTEKRAKEVVANLGSGFLVALEIKEPVKKKPKK